MLVLSCLPYSKEPVKQKSERIYVCVYVYVFVYVFVYVYMYARSTSEGRAESPLYSFLPPFQSATMSGCSVIAPMRLLTLALLRET